MKKLILSAAVSVALISCGGSHKEDTATAEVKKDTTAAKPEAPAEPDVVVKDYKYYLNLAKNFTLDGTPLSHFNTYNDSAGSAYSVNLRNYEKGAAFNEVVMACGPLKNYIGEDRKNFENFTVEGYNKMMNFNREKGTPEIKGQEYESNGKKFIYSIRKNIKGMMGGKDHNIIGYTAVIDGFVLNGNVFVNDVKSDMVKAEEVMKKLADYFAK
ncbi:MAG: hypothetical protein K0S32_2841 [Bacteroidetes bacterium]|jgi:hypothetical protein|nr:hypothetical protein [Bacteroidota bacterium]